MGIKKRVKGYFRKVFLNKNGFEMTFSMVLYLVLILLAFIVFVFIIVKSGGVASDFVKGIGKFIFSWGK